MKLSHEQKAFELRVAIYNESMIYSNSCFAKRRATTNENNLQNKLKKSC